MEAKWISISEQLPEEGKCVLCADDFDGWIEVLKWERHWPHWVTRRGDPAHANPTHWSHLPEPPEEK
jgi:hypothetical protein